MSFDMFSTWKPSVLRYFEDQLPDAKALQMAADNGQLVQIIKRGDSADPVGPFPAFVPPDIPPAPLNTGAQSLGTDALNLAWQQAVWALTKRANQDYFFRVAHWNWRRNKRDNPGGEGPEPKLSDFLKD